MAERTNKPAILIMAKAPIPGFCKTRMQPAFTPEQCASLQDALFKDLMALKKELEPRVHVWVSFTPKDSEVYFQAFSSRIFGQKGKDLGERMHHGLAYLLAQSYQPVLVIGTDTPLRKQDIYKAFELLKEDSVVLGPAEDGGYHLLGVTRDFPVLFSDMPWGTNLVLEETERRAARLGLTVRMLDKKRDIDNPDDLRVYEKLTTNHHLDKWKEENLNRLK
ncbi:hypothetical protein EV207_10730 [Scopulibacillus darangshiensis]|uniref:Glycosyltransferase A (GT-A) superfamily protein (DUF2064 family) n=1 Tax=Scopulibacillus darangshiensis TaxID=442528 RepID=A0A4V2SN59_9BACL|nr:TIGR04282 family arsenosugar biosynthesis glycosyltransferase [Scopulibacillus darangshiensis]TCP29936.1 hypothetical protein EV207_10730 [Scopulibacillus darangshiensis]